MEEILYVHVVSASVALFAAFVALAVRKGADVHKRSGYVFAAAMMLMAIPAMVLSYDAEKPFDVLSSLVTFYMVLTALVSFRAVTRYVTLSLASLGALCLVGYLTVELGALLTGVRATDAPAGAGYIFASVLGMAIWGDYRSQREPLSRRRLTLRHLWRMNFALLLATASFFGARPHLFPDWMRSYGVLILLTFIPVLVMAYWGFMLRGSSK